MPLHNKPKKKTGNTDRRRKGVAGKRPPYLVDAPPGVTKEYKVTTPKCQTYIPCNDEDIIQPGIYTAYRHFVGKTLQDFTDWMYVECMDTDFNEPEITVEQITR